MKRLLILLTLGAALLSFTACQTAQTDIISISLRTTVAIGASASLSKNPAYITSAQALIDGIDIAITQNATITKGGIAKFVNDVAARTGLPTVETIVFTSLAQQIYTVYVEKYKTTVIKSADPAVLIYVNAFKNGLSDAIAAVNASKKT